MNKTSIAITALVIVAAAAIGFYGFAATQSAAAQDFNTASNTVAAAANDCQESNCQQNANAQAASITNGAFSQTGDQSIDQQSTQSNTAEDSFNTEN